MEIFGNLPTWAIVLLALLLAAVLMIENLGWLLAVKAQLEANRRQGDAANARPPRKSRRR